MPPTWPCFVCSDDLQLSSWSCFCRCCSHQWKEPCAHRGHRQEPILFLWAQQRGRQEQPRALYKRRFCSMKLISHLQSYLYRTLITGDATDVVRCTQRAYHATGVYCLRNILRGSKPTPLSNWCSFSGWGNIIIAGPHSLWHGRSIQGTRLHVYMPTSSHNPCSCTPLSYFVNCLPSHDDVAAASCCCHMLTLPGPHQTHLPRPTLLLPGAHSSGA